jgi:membrane dipeptidase
LPVFIVDAHEDIAFNALHHDRDVRRSVRRTRELELAGASANCCGTEPLPETAMVGLPEHRRGGVGLVFATVFTLPGPQEDVTADAWAQIGYYRALAEERTGARLITDRSALDQLVRDWRAADAPAERPVGFVLLMEGADPVRDPADLEGWHRAGLRIIGPAWHGTRYAGGTQAPGPLTEQGRALLRQMERLGIVLDQSHMAEESFWQALDTFSGTVIASHSNCRAFVPGDRHLTDEMVRAIAARDGVIGAVLANRFLVAGWQPDDAPVTTEDVVRHIDHVCQLTGSARHCGIGSDFDGGFGVESTPDELDSVADLGEIGAALERHGYAAADIAGILGENWLRVLRGALPE